MCRKCRQKPHGQLPIQVHRNQVRQGVSFCENELYAPEFKLFPDLWASESRRVLKHFRLHPQ